MVNELFYLKWCGLCHRPLLGSPGCHFRGSVRPFWHCGDLFWRLAQAAWGALLGSILAPGDRLGTGGPPWIDTEWSRRSSGPEHRFWIDFVTKFKAFWALRASHFIFAVRACCDFVFIQKRDR